MLSLLFEDGQLDTLALRQRNHRLVTGTNRENVREASGKVLASGIGQVNDFEGALVLFTSVDDTDTTSVSTTGDHAQSTGVKLDKVGDFVGGDVNHDGVTFLDQRIRVSDGSRVVQLHARNALVAQLLLDHLAQLVLRFNTGDSVHDKSTFLVVHQSEVFVRLFNFDDVHDTARVALLHAHLAVNLDQALLEDRRDFLVVQRVLQTVSQDQAQREAFARLVRTCSRVEGKKNEIIRVSLCSVIKASRKKNLHERRETRKEKS